MSLASVATRGYQPSGSVSLIATFGYGQGASPPPPPPPPVPDATPVPYGPARGWPLFRRKRCDEEHQELCKEERKLEKQLEKPVNTALLARKAKERRASLELVKARIAALQEQMDEDDFNDLMLIDELDDLED